LSRGEAVSIGAIEVMGVHIRIVMRLEDLKQIGTQYALVESLLELRVRGWIHVVVHARKS
jgi:hypothetical protein